MTPSIAHFKKKITSNPKGSGEGGGRLFLNCSFLFEETIILNVNYKIPYNGLGTP